MISGEHTARALSRQRKNSELRYANRIFHTKLSSS